MLVKEEGKVTEVIPVQPLNAYLPIVVIPSGNVIVSILIQSQNAPHFIFLIVLGNFIFNFLQ